MEPETIGASAPPSSPPSPPPSAPEGTGGAPGANQGAPSAERSEGASGRWFQSAIDRLRGRSVGEPRPERAPDQPPEGQEAQPPAWAPPATPEEERRRFQSQRDRERAQQARQEYQQQQQQREQQIAQLEARKSELLKSGAQPWEIGEEVAQLEGQILAVREGAQTEDHEGQLIGTVTSFYDQIYGDAYLEPLPPPVRQKILAQEWNGIEGRQQLARAILSALADHYRAEGAKHEQSRSRTNPSYRKQLAHEFGLNRETPDSVAPALTGGAPVTPDMNAWIRRASGR